MMFSCVRICSSRLATTSGPRRSSGPIRPTCDAQPPGLAFALDDEDRQSHLRQREGGPHTGDARSDNQDARLGFDPDRRQGLVKAHLATPARTRLIPFAVAPGVSPLCTQEHCSRRLT